MSEENPSAFPHEYKISTGNTQGPLFRSEFHNGMSLRDYFAAKAMQGILAASPDISPEQYASDAYIYADAMLDQRSKEK